MPLAIFPSALCKVSRAGAAPPHHLAQLFTGLPRVFPPVMPLVPQHQAFLTSQELLGGNPKWGYLQFWVMPSYGTVSFLLRQEGVPACAREFTQLGWCTVMPVLTCFWGHRFGPWSGSAHCRHTLDQPLLRAQARACRQLLLRP